jgi:hypothetical protein
MMVDRAAPAFSRLEPTNASLLFLKFFSFNQHFQF